MSTFPDQLRQYGGVPVGMGRLSEIFNAGNIWFVDYDNGSSANEGTRPNWAFDIPSTAVSAASKEGIIYIRPRTSLTCADVYYSDNITVPVTKPHLQFIGCGAGTIPGYRSSAQLRVSTTTSPLFTIHASGVVIENLHLNTTDATTGAGLVVEANRTSTYPGAVSLQMRNNRILARTTDNTAIQMGSCQYSIIEDNLFLDCPRAIHLEATYGSPQSNIVRRNIFSGLASVRDCDIFVTMTDINSRGHVIAHNIFADDKPASASARYQVFIDFSSPSTNSSTGIICGNYFASDNTGHGTDGFGPTGSEANIPASWLVVGNFYQGIGDAAPYGIVTPDVAA